MSNPPKAERQVGKPWVVGSESVASAVRRETFKVIISVA